MACERYPHAARPAIDEEKVGEKTPFDVQDFARLQADGDSLFQSSLRLHGSDRISQSLPISQKRHTTELLLVHLLRIENRVTSVFFHGEPREVSKVIATTTETQNNGLPICNLLTAEDRVYFSERRPKAFPQSRVSYALYKLQLSRFSLS